ncbi:MAG: hypothetical protein HY360_10610 [Verrucomicrobia bacterium]|nr:hypothetical protein [Verrucomicrobiota bacterium]
MHAPELLVFTGMVGISPTTLPPASGQNTLQFGPEQYTLCGKTRLTDAGEEVELRWSKIPA